MADAVEVPFTVTQIECRAEEGAGFVEPRPDQEIRVYLDQKTGLVHLTPAPGSVWIGELASVAPDANHVSVRVRAEVQGSGLVYRTRA